MRVFCTYFDSGYMARGLAMYESLHRVASSSEIWILTLDEQAEQNKTLGELGFLEDITNESIGDLSDVNLAGLADTNVLVYNSTSGDFEPGTSGVSNHASTHETGGGDVIDLSDQFSATGHLHTGVYDPINMFHLLHWAFDMLWWIGFIILFVSSLMLYRPFCYIACPIGALTWILEKVAPGRIRVDHDACTECEECYDASPCPTIKPMVEQNMKTLPDCTSCGECATSCPEDAISFGFVKKGK